MQVLSRQRGVSLIEFREPENAGASARGCGLAGTAARRRERGFTLVELLITMAVALVLIMIAVPSFKNITLSNKLTTTANDIVNAINVARMEAVKRNSSTQLCSNSADNNTTSDALGTACTTQAGAVYVVTGDAITQVLASPPGINTPIRLNSDMVAVRFTGQGLGKKVGTSAPYTGTIADICTSQMDTNNHRLIKMTAGSIIETTPSNGNCPSS